MSETPSADIRISASPAQVRLALTEQEQVAEWFFGGDVVASADDGAPDSPVSWRGDLDGTPFEVTWRLEEVGDHTEARVDGGEGDAEIWENAVRQLKEHVERG